MSLTDEGTVYVFDDVRGEVARFGVGSETVDTVPPSVVRHTWWMSVPQDLRSAFSDYVDSREDLQDMGPLVLPTNFEVRSIAGVLLDPNHATTAIETWFSEQDEVEVFINQLTALMSKLVTLQIPMTANALVDRVVLTIEFPDGSSMDFTMETSMNTRNSKLGVELVPSGNARTADGRAAPNHAISYRGRTFFDHDGSLLEWIALARDAGIPIVRAGGSGSGTIMRCVVQDNHVICRVIHKPR